MAESSKNRWAGLLIGPVMIFLALSAIWKNETRFDYHLAAKEALVIPAATYAVPGHNLALTGPMDQGLTLVGEYVDSFTGYLMVRRSAEIYAWSEDEDDEGNVTWSRKWMSGVENNSRNSGITQQLSSRRFMPDEYQVGDLRIRSELMEFVDPVRGIGSGELEVVHRSLEPRGEYLYWSKGGSNQIGDERVTYRGVPVPPIATYFGHFDGEYGVADTSEMRSGWVNEIIQDSGVLHHLVAGEREDALATMQAHIRTVKWIVRGVASAVVLIGFLIFFSTMLGFLYGIPLIGDIARFGVWILSISFTLPLVLLTMLLGYFVANPLALAVVSAPIVVGVVLLRQRNRATQRVIYHDLESRYGTALQKSDLKELEFIELAQLAFADNHLDPSEEKFLRRWATKQGWDDARFTQLLTRAKQEQSAQSSEVRGEEHLRNLVRLALADGHLSQSELSAIERAAKRMGYEHTKVARLTQEVQQLAMG